MGNIRVLMGAVSVGIAMAGSAFAEVSVGDDSICMKMPSLVAQMPKNRNYCPTLTGIGPGGRFGIVLQSRIWYHGRTGNARRFYQDQDEFTWPTESHETTESAVVVRTGTVDYDVRREVAIESADGDAIRLDYLLTTKDTRFYDQVGFPFLCFSKEAKKVSYDDGRLGAFRTAENPTAADLIRSRACLLHFPEHGKTLLLLVDVNRPLSLGHELGTAISQSVNGWSRAFEFRMLGYEEFPFFEKGTRLGVRMWFKLLDGGAFSDGQAAAARALAAAVGAKDASFAPTVLDCEYASPSVLAGTLPAPAGISLWTETPMKRAYPDTRAPERRIAAVKLESAANERESFQLVLRSAKEMIVDAVSFSDFVSGSGSRIGAANGAVCRLGYETIADAKALFRGETRFADRMIPVAKGTVLPAEENAIFHLTVFTPPGTPAGAYLGKVVLTLNGVKIDVPVELKVWNVELPKDPAYIGHMVIWSSPQSRREQVLKRFSECGMMGSVYGGEGAPQIRACFDGRTLRMPDGFALAEKSVKEYGAPYFGVPWGFMGAWDWNTNKTVFLGLDLKLDSREFDENFSNYLTDLHGQLAEKGILDRGFIYMWDEMSEGHYPAMLKTTAMVRKFAPGLKILTVAGPDRDVVANNDIIVASDPAHWWNDEAREIVRTANRDGKKIWMYANSLTFGTASRALIPRLTAWLCRSHGMCGYLHWSCDYNWKANDFAQNGNEWLLYPSEGEPVYSVRMEYFRDGAEDFSLLRLVRRLPKEIRANLERRIAEISSDRSALLVRPEKVADVRRLVATALESQVEMPERGRGKTGE